MDAYLKHAPIERLVRERRITEGSAETLTSLQDLVYFTSDDGQLQGMFEGTAFEQGGTLLGLDAIPVAEPMIAGATPLSLIDLTIDRTNVGYDRNWVGFHRRRWRVRAKTYSSFVLSCLETTWGQKEAQAILQLATTSHKLDFIEALARRIWESPFENYSRFTGHQLVYKSGDETIRNIIEGDGAICSEKVQALKFITDHYGLPSEYLFAGANAVAPIPEAKLRELLVTFDFTYSKRYQRYWQHTALLYTIDGLPLLVDATNGNIPFLFLRGPAAERILADTARRPVTVRMVESREDFYYHRVAQDIPENLFFALEGWIPYADLMQVVENELGLHISKKFFVTPILYRSARGFDRLEQEYARICDKRGLRYTAVRDWTLDSALGQELMEEHPRAGESILLSQGHLTKRYNEWDGPGHQAGLIIIQLKQEEEAKTSCQRSS
jgi:hypothetical protein